MLNIRWETKNYERSKLETAKLIKIFAQKRKIM